MSGSRASKGCQQCRKRKVKCDEGRPSCNRCIQRDEACYGYRDPQNTYLFKSENERTATLVSRAQARPRRRASSLSSTSRLGITLSSSSIDDSDLEIAAQNLDLGAPYPWLKDGLKAREQSVEKRAVDKFFEKFVLFPCNSSSSSGFLEQLPMLFEEVQTEGRVGLRWAVRAASFASLNNEQGNEELERKASVCYGKALEALGDSLRNKEEAVSDYTLMTVVMLDLFETIFIQNSTHRRGAHTEGMAQILRLRGPDQIYSARGWSLYRLAHHRLQQQQLAFDSAPAISQEQEDLLSSLTPDTPSNRITHDNFAISKICATARELRAKLLAGDELSDVETMELVRKMVELDRTATGWRAGPNWVYRDVRKDDIVGAPEWFPVHIQLHHDAWIAYEWNYHRTGRIILHTHILECLDRLLASLSLATSSYPSPPHRTSTSTSSDSTPTLSELQEYYTYSKCVISSLATQIVSTAPQSLGFIDSAGALLIPSPEASGFEGEILEEKKTLQGVGAYFLLWPIKVVKGNKHVGDGERESATLVSEMIRDVTGMKGRLGERSCF